jgi:adenosylcobinamide hydrolase
VALDQPPQILLRHEDGLELAARYWHLREPMLAISSAPLGGGLGLRHWVLNAQVPHGYDCGEPEQHLATLAGEAGVSGAGIGMLTAVDVRTASSVHQEGIDVDATVGVTLPQWAAAEEPTPGLVAETAAPTAGTINVVVALPERLSDAALVNAISTVTEAKTQALWEAGVRGTGTPTDAVCILCPPEGTAHAYGGPRSLWGARLARAVHRAVSAGLAPGAPS